MPDFVRFATILPGCRNHFMLGNNFGVLRCLLLRLDYYYLLRILS